MRKIAFFVVVFLLAAHAPAQIRSDYRQKELNWTRTASRIDNRFFYLYTDEAKRIADNLVIYQLESGAWPKNVYFPAEITPEQKEKIIADKKHVERGTIDNGSTTTEIAYLSKMYNVVRDEKYKEAALKGIEYLLAAQYENGGWPQFYPNAKGYARHITYNDNAMVNAMRVLQAIFEYDPLYWYVPAELRGRAKTAFDKGVQCILATQVVQDGKPTVWCAQHDFETLAPAKARAYELPSLSGQESDNIVLLLMDIPNPSPEVIAAVENAVAWFEKSKIEGIRLEYYRNDKGQRDYRVVACEKCPPMWARFYDLETNRPFFCDRDGIKKYDMSQIGHERRTGYSWYNRDGSRVLARYKMWKREHQGQAGREIPRNRTRW